MSKCKAVLDSEKVTSITVQGAAQSSEEPKKETAAEPQQS